MVIVSTSVSSHTVLSADMQHGSGQQCVGMKAAGASVPLRRWYGWSATTIAEENGTSWRLMWIMRREEGAPSTGDVLGAQCRDGRIRPAAVLYSARGGTLRAYSPDSCAEQVEKSSKRK